MASTKEILKKYYTDVCCLLTEMNKSEALEFFSKFKFKEDEIYITTMTDEEISNFDFDELNDDNIDDYNDTIDNNTLEYSENIINDIKNLPDNINIYISLDDEIYNSVYCKLMREKILSNQSNIEKYLLFIELNNSYIEYLKLPDRIKDKSLMLNDIKLMSSDFIQKLFCDEKFFNIIVMAYKILKDYEILQEIDKINNKYKLSNNINSVNDIVRNELMLLYEKEYTEKFDRIAIFETIYNNLNNNKDFYTKNFNKNKSIPLCKNDYVKLLIINDSYIMSEITTNDLKIVKDYDDTILDIYEIDEQDELIEKFNTDKQFALKCFLLFIDFNKCYKSNISKASLKESYGDINILKKINKLHFLNYTSKD